MNVLIFQNSEFKDQLVMLNYGKNFDGTKIPKFKRRKYRAS